MNLPGLRYLVLCGTCLTAYAFGQPTQIKYLSGIDKDHTVEWEFKVSGGRNNGVCSTLNGTGVRMTHFFHQANAADTPSFANSLASRLARPHI
jgi:hypothetical protein